MDWDDLRIFLAVSRTESLSGAGRRLGMDASTIGRRIARLERAVGAALFAKTPQGYVLTAEGARLVAPAEAAEQGANAAAEAVRREAGLTGQLRIGAPFAYSATMILGLLGIAAATMGVNPMIAMATTIALSVVAATLIRVAT